MAHHLLGLGNDLPDLEQVVFPLLLLSEQIRVHQIANYLGYTIVKSPQLAVLRRQLLGSCLKIQQIAFQIVWVVPRDLAG